MRIERVNNQNKPHRWEWIKAHHPDFDIFIDDDKSWIKSVRSHFGDDKIYVINDYKTNRDLQADNIYHVKTEVSDLKDQDFAIAALEKNLARLEKEIKEESKKKTEWWPTLLPLGVICLGIVLMLLVLLVPKKLRNKKK